MSPFAITSDSGSSQSDPNSCPPLCNSPSATVCAALPAFIPLSDPKFSWGDKAPERFCIDLKAVYEEVVHWKKS